MLTKKISEIIFPYLSKRKAFKRLVNWFYIFVWFTLVYDGFMFNTKKDSLYGH